MHYIHLFICVATIVDLKYNHSMGEKNKKSRINQYLDNVDDKIEVKEKGLIFCINPIQCGFPKMMQTEQIRNPWNR